MSRDSLLETVSRDWIALRDLSPYIQDNPTATNDSRAPDYASILQYEVQESDNEPGLARHPSNSR